MLPYFSHLSFLCDKFILKNLSSSSLKLYNVLLLIIIIISHNRKPELNSSPLSHSISINQYRLWSGSKDLTVCCESGAIRRTEYGRYLNLRHIDPQIPSHQFCQYLHLDKIPRCFSWTVKFGRNCPQPQFSFTSMHCVQHTIYYSQGVKTVLEIAQGQSSGLNTIPYTCTKGNCCQVWREKADVEMYLVSWGRSTVSAHSEPHCNAHSGLPISTPHTRSQWSCPTWSWVRQMWEVCSFLRLKLKYKVSRRLQNRKQKRRGATWKRRFSCLNMHGSLKVW